MLDVHDGQCGLCKHFGEHHAGDHQIVEIHEVKKAPEDLVEECGHPQHADLHLVVTAVSGCDGFEKAAD